MWYGDPKEARKAAHHAAKAARKAAKYAQRGAYYPSRYRYGRRGGGIFGVLIVLLLLLHFFGQHLIGLTIGGMIVLAIVGIAIGLMRAGTNSQRAPFMNYQQPPQQPFMNYQQPPYPPYGSPPPQGQPYEQGYAAQPQPQSPYAERTEQYYYPPQHSDEQPQAQYPEQMPPMQ